MYLPGSHQTAKKRARRSAVVLHTTFSLPLLASFSSYTSKRALQTALTNRAVPQAKTAEICQEESVSAKRPANTVAEDLYLSQTFAMANIEDTWSVVGHGGNSERW